MPPILTRKIYPTTSSTLLYGRYFHVVLYRETFEGRLIIFLKRAASAILIKTFNTASTELFAERLSMTISEPLPFQKRNIKNTLLHKIRPKIRIFKFI